MIKKFIVNFIFKRYGLSIIKVAAAKVAAVAAGYAGVTINPLELEAAAYLGVQGVWVERECDLANAALGWVSRAHGQALG